MTNAELNTHIDVTCFKVDQSRKMCGARPGAVVCENSMGCCFGYEGTTYRLCEDRKPYTPPDYCNDWAAYGKLVEWCDWKCWHVTIEPDRNSNGYAVTVINEPDHYPPVIEATRQLALARAVYKATKGK